MGKWLSVRLWTKWLWVRIQFQSYLCLNKTNICKYKANDNVSLYKFCLGSVSKDFTKYDPSGIFLNGTIYDFSVDHSSTNIH